MVPAFSVTGAGVDINPSLYFVSHPRYNVIYRDWGKGKTSGCEVNRSWTNGKCGRDLLMEIISQR